MVKNPHILQRFEDEENRASPADFERILKLLEAMFEHAQALGAWERSSDTLPTKLRLAQALNV
ncbi:MAG TPA: hypothetical protein VNM24_06450 [Burkholderiales bacterium]|jgi:hypothetical protein|nr:hypothetical protein [Burkholderiales bacterium]